MNMSKVKIKSQYLLYLAQIVILAMVYFGVAKIGLSLASYRGIVTLVWPPTGTALAALLLFGYRFWPGIALGALLVTSGGVQPTTGQIRPENHVPYRIEHWPAEVKHAPR
jgi:integral membrane sensor domain MASE1